MPEGHTIHRIAADMNEAFSARSMSVTSPQGRFDTSTLDGRVLDRASATGKLLWIHFGDDIVHIHLGLIGKFRPVPVSQVPGDTIRLRIEAVDATADEAAWHLTGPSTCTIVTPEERDAAVAKLGVDPLGRYTKPDRFIAAASGKRRPIGAVLLDQSVICGIGNVYRAELLFLCGIDPRRLASALSDDELASIWKAARLQLRRGFKLNRIVTRATRELSVPLERVGDEARLYAYKVETCRRCRNPIEMIELANRKLWFCPTCQTAGDPDAATLAE